MQRAFAPRAASSGSSRLIGRPLFIGRITSSRGICVRSIGSSSSHQHSSSLQAEAPSSCKPSTSHYGSSLPETKMKLMHCAASLAFYRLLYFRRRRIEDDSASIPITFEFLNICHTEFRRECSFIDHFRC